MALGSTGDQQFAWRVTPTARYHVSISPLPATFGCNSELGYRLRIDVTPMHTVFLSPFVGSTSGQELFKDPAAVFADCSPGRNLTARRAV